MSEKTNDIDALLHDVAHLPVTHARVAALVAERDALARENEAQTYKGNSVWYWNQKAKEYGGCIDSLWIMLSAAGYPPDGMKPIVDALTALVAERDVLRRRVAAQDADLLAAANAILHGRLESHPPADRERELRERLVCAALTALCADPRYEVADAERVVAIADATLAAMRKGDTDGK
jgi:hypothetical protein